MSTLTVKEATRFFRAYGIKCEEQLVEEWVNETKDSTKTNNHSHQICEENLHDFNDWCRWKGTTNEEGIDDQTKIERLMEELDDLRRKVETLEMEKRVLEERIGVLPF